MKLYGVFGKNKDGELHTYWVGRTANTTVYKSLESAKRAKSQLRADLILEFDIKDGKEVV